MLVCRSNPVGVVIIVVRAFSLNNLLKKRTNRGKLFLGKLFTQKCLKDNNSRTRLEKKGGNKMNFGAFRSKKCK